MSESGRPMNDRMPEEPEVGDPFSSVVLSEWMDYARKLRARCVALEAKMQGQLLVPQEKLEEIINALDGALGDTDITHFETDEEYRENVPIQWACTQLSLLLAAAKRGEAES